MDKFINTINKFLLIILSVSVLALSRDGLNTSNSADYEFERGLSYFNSGKYDKAVVHFSSATEIDPESGKAYLYLGRSYINQGKWMEALEPVRTAYRLSPQNTKIETADILLDVLYTVITNKIKNGDFEDANHYIAEYLKQNNEMKNSDNLLLSSMKEECK